jgi:hypothetical protein
VITLHSRQQTSSSSSIVSDMSFSKDCCDLLQPLPSGHTVLACTMYDMLRHGDDAVSMHAYIF